MDAVIEMMPANGHGLGGANYELFDPSEHSDAAVYYYLEDIDVMGATKRSAVVDVNIQPDSGERCLQRGLAHGGAVHGDLGADEVGEDRDGAV